MADPLALAAHLRALLDAAACIYEQRDASAVDAAVTAVDLAFWETLGGAPSDDDDNLPQVLQELGIYLAGMDTASPERMVSLLHGLLMHEAFRSSIPLLQIVRMTFRGWKLTKRWDCLQQASHQWIHEVFSKCTSPSESIISSPFQRTALRLYMELLVGYQHKADLYVAQHAQILQLIQLIAQDAQATMENAEEEVRNAILRHLVTASHALMHVHRGYEREATAIRHLLKQHDALFKRYQPAASARDAMLRLCSWIRPMDEMHAFLAPVEGKWVLDEISTEQQHPATAIQTNAGSVLLRKDASCFVQEVSAQIQDRSKGTSHALDGHLFFQLPTSPRAADGVSWRLEGHWSHVLSNSTAAVVPTPAPVGPWSCAACTFNNEPHATKCATCGTDAPAMSTSTTLKNGVTQSNPAPFVATLSPDGSFMYIRWSRGEQQGVWLARKSVNTHCFTLQSALEALSIEDQESLVPARAYSSKGSSDNVLVLPKPLTLLSRASDITIQLWIRPIATAEATKQVVWANGECELYLSPTCELVWEAYSGLYVVKSSSSISLEAFSHVTLQWTSTQLVMMIDDMVSVEVLRNPAQEASVSNTSVFTIGGRVDNAFHGIVVELRIWSTRIDDAILSPTQALRGNEDHLIAYFPLVGEAERVLMDLSSGENHACVSNPSTCVAPSSSVDNLPVRGLFDRSLGPFLLSGSFGHESDRLVIHPQESGAAMWYQDVVSTAHGFETSIALSSTCENHEVIVAMGSESYWKLLPLFDEAMNAAGPLYDGAAMFLRVSSSINRQDGGRRCAIQLVIWWQQRPHILSRVCHIAASCDEFVVSYEAHDQRLSVSMGDHANVLECAVDLEAALRLQSSPPRMGLIFPANQSSLTLHKWTFQALAASSSSPSLRVLETVYPLMKSPTAAQEDGTGSSASTVDATTAGSLVQCSKHATDGSAIEQETYGCQTCGLVHGAALCRICAAVCHDGHELVAMGTLSSVCACHVRSSGVCSCMQPVKLEDHLVLQSSLPLRTTLWCCNKCTVLNESTHGDCSVCGNKAPSVAGPSPSRALVEAVPTAPVVHEQQADWSCGACTMLNAASATKCSICDTMRPAPVPSDGLMTLCQAANSTTSSPWTCGACTMENKASDSVCYMCSTPRDVPVAQPVDVPMASPPPVPPSVPVTPVPLVSHSDSVQVENRRRLEAYQHSVAQQLLPSQAYELNQSTWESTVGLIQWKTRDDPFIGDWISGVYAENDGEVSGLAKLAADGTWKLDGRYKKHSQTQENAFSIQWDRSLTRFDGKWYRGDGAGEWKCVQSPLSNEFRGLVQPFYSGLINMKQNLTNVCYQNSFLQTLLMTEDFGRLVLSCDVSQYPAIPLDEAHRQSDLLHCLQQLFARLTASQRPQLDSHALQSCLPSTFQAGRQQDTSDFAHFVIDLLSQQLAQQPETVESIAEIFGGHQATILSCKSCQKTSVNREYFWELLLNLIDLKYTPITSIAAVSGNATDLPPPEGYERLNSDLNKDRTNAPYVFLCVQRCREMPAQDQVPITEIVIKAVPAIDPKPTMHGYERVEMDLNAGGSSAVVGGKKQVYLFFRRDPNGSPITDLQVIYGNESVPDGFKAIRVDLNQGDGTKVFVCYCSDMPITDLKIVNNGLPGYKLIDHLLNKNHQDNVKQYVALKVSSGSDSCLTDLRLVDAASIESFEAQGWEAMGSPSSAMTASAAPSQLMVRRGHGNPIVAVDVFRAPRDVPKYQDYEVIDLYPPPENRSLMGDWMATEETERSHKALRLESLQENTDEVLLVRGTFEDHGELVAVATTKPLWSNTVTADSPDAQPKRCLQLCGYWKSAKVKTNQLVSLELHHDGSPTGICTVQGRMGDGKGASTLVNGTQTSTRVKTKWPISQVIVLRGDERVPEGVEVVRETCSGRSGNLLAQTQSPYSLYLAVKREETPVDGAYIGDICVIYGEIDAVPENYVCIQSTPGGFSANVNDGTPTGVPMFVCYRRTASVTESCLMDLALMWTSGAQADTTVPSGFTKIQHTPLGMDANLNQGTRGVAIHLCFAKCDPTQIQKPEPDRLNGEYEFPTSPMQFVTLSVAERLEHTTTLDGRFGPLLHGPLAHLLHAVVFQSRSKPRPVMLGLWSNGDQQPAESYPFELSVGANELEGWWSSGSSLSTWKLVKDTYVRLAFKKDYGTEWRDGVLVSSERVAKHDMASMVARFVAKRTLGGDNMLSCDACERKTESRTHTVIVDPPKHLIVTIKRMYYDWMQQKTRKCLHDVQFPAHLVLPALDPDDEQVLFSSTEPVPMPSRQYGLYGVLVHSGLTANSGHYYSFCRDSSNRERQLHLEDAPSAPWIKFNDMKVETSSWKEIHRTIAHSVSDSVYLLLYKRLSEEEQQPEEDADEAMLLAKAMALSMSTQAERVIDPRVLQAVEQSNQMFMETIVQAMTSRAYADDLYTLMALRLQLPPSDIEHIDI